MKIFKAAFIGLLATLLIAPVAMGSIMAKVIAVVDGDTIIVRDYNGEGKTIRLACIDAPELSQVETGQPARRYLNELIPPGSNVEIHEVADSPDKYRRVIAKIIANGKLINLAMVASGQAVIYDKYSTPCIGSGESAGMFQSAQDKAKREGLGVWADPNFILPWNWRNRPTTQRMLPPGEWPICALTDCDCSDLTQSEAQRLFEAIPGDPYNLDSNRNQKACERRKGMTPS